MNIIESTDKKQPEKQVQLSGKPIGEPVYFEDYSSLYVLTEKELFILDTENCTKRDSYKKDDLVGEDSENCDSFSGMSVDERYVYCTVGNYLVEVNTDDGYTSFNSFGESRLLKPVLQGKYVYVINENGSVNKVSKNNLECIHNTRWPYQYSEESVIFNPITDGMNLYYVQGDVLIALSLDDATEVFSIKLNDIPASYWIENQETIGFECKPYITINIKMALSDRDLFIQGDYIGIPLRTTVEYTDEKPVGGKELKGGLKDWNLIYVNKNNYTQQTLFSEEKEPTINIQSIVPSSENITGDSIPYTQTGEKMIFHKKGEFITELKWGIGAMCIDQADKEPKVINDPKSVYDLVMTPDNKYIYTIDRYGNSISVIDINTNSYYKSIDVYRSPSKIAITPNGQYVYVLSYDGATIEGGTNGISVIDTNTNACIKSITLDNRPCDIAITPDSKYVYVVTDDSNKKLHVIDINKNSFYKSIDLDGYPNKIAMTPDGKYAYVTCDNKVCVIDIDTNSCCTAIDLPTELKDIKITPDGRYAYVISDTLHYDGEDYSKVYVIDINANSYYDSIYIEQPLCDIAITPDSRYAYIIYGRPNIKLVGSVIDINTNAICENSIPLGTYINNIAMTPDSKYAYIASRGEGKVYIIDINTNKYYGNPIKLNVRSVPDGAGAYGIIINKWGNRAYVTTGDNNIVSVIDIKAEGEFRGENYSFFKTSLFSKCRYKSSEMKGPSQIFFTFRKNSVSEAKNMNIECFIGIGSTLVLSSLTTFNSDCFIDSAKFYMEKVYNLGDMQIDFPPISVENNRTVILGEYEKDGNYYAAFYNNF